MNGSAPVAEVECFLYDVAQYHQGRCDLGEEVNTEILAILGSVNAG